MNTQLSSLSSSSSSSSSTPKWKYDVFLSFRDMDTRNGFTSHLYNALIQKGIFTCMDDKRLRREKSIAPEILEAIEKSRFAVVILSKNYASSTWCLFELAKIVECMEGMSLTVLPVFYYVLPSDIRKQRGTFEQAFAKHQADNVKEMEPWKAALAKVADLSGWVVQDRKYESESIRYIADHISQTLRSKFSSITKDFVGIDSPMEELITLYLGLGNSVCMMGICGMGGLGKTTLARVIYETICNHFEGSSFIANIREVSEKHGLVQLQKQLLAQILEESNIDIWNVYEGALMIKNRLRHKKVLLVLDDVNQLNQLEILAREPHWFGLGSWIIITTRDEHLLAQHGVHNTYKLNTLDDDNALKLFCLKAFKNEQPELDYVQLSQEVVNYAKGLPLALVTLGSFLVGRTTDEWQSALNIWKKNRPREIFDILKVSYDGLEEMWKEIFLDIACFFRGKRQEQVIEILENCGFNANLGISVLVDKSLVTIEKNRLWMNDLLQEMGREIVRQESRREPGKRSRLWLRKDLFHVLKNDTATKAIQAIVLDPFSSDEACLNLEACPKAFSKMCNLRLLILDNVHIPDGLNHLSNKLSFLEWSGYSSKCLPSSFQSTKLVELKLCFSEIEYLWRGVKNLNNLKLIDLGLSKNLIRTPDFTGVPRLERLCLRGCINLVEIHPSIGLLRRLAVLNLEFCRSLINLPSNMDGLQSLEILVLFGCSKLANLPENLGKIEFLKELDLTETAIREVPSSINFLICRGCEKQIFKSRLPSVVCFRSLKYLSLYANKHVFALPASISQLQKLEALNLGNCIQLHSLPEFPSNVRYINAKGCRSLEPSPALLSMSNLLQPSICFFNCFKLVEYNEGSDGLAFAILKLYLQGLIYPKTGYKTSTKRKDRPRAAFHIISPGFIVPPWLTHQRFGSSITIELPPNWCNIRWMGFALCAFFRINCSGYLSERYRVKCHVISLGNMPHHTCEVFIGETSFEYSVGHLWLLYFSREDWLATGWNYQCSQLKVVFETNSPRVEVIKCAVRLIYEQDVEELGLTTAQCSSSSVDTLEGSDCVHHEFENSAVVKATKFKGTYDDDKEAKPSANWSFSEETERAMGETKDEVKEGKTEQFRWSKPTQCLLPEKLANETIKGNKPSITFMPGSFTQAATAIHENFEAHPDSDQYLNKKIEMYDEMDLVLGKDKATWNSAKSVTETDLEKRIVDLESCDIDIIDSEKASKGKQVSFSNAALSQARSNRKRSQANVNQYENYDKCLEKLEKIELEIKKLKKDEPDVKELYEEVMKTEGFDEVMLGSAFDYLLSNEREAQAFIVKSAKLRTSWLESFFNKNGGYEN